MSSNFAEHVINHREPVADSKLDQLNPPPDLPRVNFDPDSAIPLRGRTLSARLLSANLTFHRVMHLLEGEFATNDELLNLAQQVAFFRGSEKIAKVEAPKILALTLVMRMILASRFDKETTLAGADQWFAEGTNQTTLSKYLTEHTRKQCEHLIKKMLESPDFLRLLSHISEVAITGSESYETRAKAWVQKRENGIFFTPDDVGEFLAKHVVSRQNCAVIDPACGTGALLRAVLRILRLEGGAPKASLESVAGFDISAVALQACAFLVADEISNALHDPRPMATIIAKRLYLGDARQICTPETLSELFDETNRDILSFISNPPYGAQLPQSLFDHQNSVQQHNPDKYLDFMDLILRNVGRNGRAGVVVPLSISYHQGSNYSSVRARLLQSPFIKIFLHFDRTPDSLFGDSVKVRNTIILLKECHDNPQAFSSSLNRWHSGSRSKMWDNLQITEFEPACTKNGVPKIAHPEERGVLNAVATAKIRLGSLVLKSTSQSGRCVWISSTAYNWISASPASETLAGSNRFECVGSLDQYAVYAILQSRFAFWWWRVWGDGFHVNQRTLQLMPIAKDQKLLNELGQLSDLGKELWRCSKDNQQYNTNSSKLSVAFCPYGRMDLIDRIDLVVLDALGLDRAFSRTLKQILRTCAIAGRDRIELQNPAHRNILFLLEADND